jgi:hypothetical protein
MELIEHEATVSMPADVQVGRRERHLAEAKVGLGRLAVEALPG